MSWRSLAVLLMVLTLAGCGEQTLKTLERKPMAPVLTAPLLQGDAGWSLEQWKGQPVIVNFWASWCPPCREEIPSMNRAWALLEPEGVQMVAVNRGESVETVERFLAHTPIHFPVALDPAEVHTQKWPILGLPATFILDAQGRAIYSATGARAWDDPALIQKILELRSSEPAS